MAQHTDPATDWGVALIAYERARRAETAFDARIFTIPDDVPSKMKDAVSDEDWALSDRLTSVRYDAEDRLMAIPSPDPIAHLRKHLIAHGEGRQTDVWDGMLEAEARRFIEDAEVMPPAASFAWNAYSEALQSLAFVERDPAMTSQQHATAALAAHRAWRRWCAAMDWAHDISPRFVALVAGVTA